MICGRLDGIASAIELAAARMVSMTPLPGGHPRHQPGPRAGPRVHPGRRRLGAGRYALHRAAHGGPGSRPGREHKVALPFWRDPGGLPVVVASQAVRRAPYHPAWYLNLPIAAPTPRSTSGARAGVLVGARHPRGRGVRPDGPAHGRPGLVHGLPSQDGAPDSARAPVRDPPRLSRNRAQPARPPTPWAEQGASPTELSATRCIYAGDALGETPLAISATARAVRHRLIPDPPSHLVCL